MVSQIDLSGGRGMMLRALGFAPGPVGIAAGLLGVGMRGNNLGFTNAARRSWGQDGLDFGQTVGGLLGFNSYGGGGSMDRLGEFRGTPVTPGGMVRSGGFLGLGGTIEGAYTPAEAQRRNAAALYGNSFGTPPVRLTPSRRPVSREAFDMNLLNGTADPIGSAIRALGASSSGGGRSPGGGRGGSHGGGRSDRSSMSSGRG